MELDQILKQVEWLDGERRKDKNTIASLEDRLNVLEGNLSTANAQVKDLSSDLTHLKSVLTRVDQLEDALSEQKQELVKQINEADKTARNREQEKDDMRGVQLDNVNKLLSDMGKQLEAVGELKPQIEARVEEERRLGKGLAEIKKEVTDSRREDEDNTRTVRLLEEGRRRDDKRLTDLQGESLALRKRVDEHRGRLDLDSDALRKVQTRVTELATVESERRDNYNNFLEKQSRQQVERDKQWNEWKTRFETIEKQAMELETYLQDMHTASRDIRQAQEAVDNVTERVDRRINEITEMQRLAEDRFRQEWSTFKADDQKRWTNYTLTQEEQTREGARLQTRITDRVDALEERAQTLDDTVEQMNEQISRRLQRLLAAARDWVNEYEQYFGRPTG